jgi:hypothetical protein
MMPEAGHKAKSQEANYKEMFPEAGHKAIIKRQSSRE